MIDWSECKTVVDIVMDVPDPENDENTRAHLLAHVVYLTPDEREYLLLCLGVGLETHSLKPGRGLTAEGVLELREKLSRA